VIALSVPPSSQVPGLKGALRIVNNSMPVVQSLKKNVGTTLNFVSARMLKLINFHAEDPQILRATVQNLTVGTGFLSRK
jgi:hypothetical protein